MLECKGNSMPKTRRPRYHRAEHPPAIQFQLRDGDILRLIADFDGVVARRHIQEVFWPHASTQVMQVRLSKLYHNGYLNWPSAAQRKTRPIPEPILWLGWRGILYLAGSQVQHLTPLSKQNESQFRRLEKELRALNIRWLREPNWHLLNHDLAVIDFRLAAQRSLEALPGFELEEWLQESRFRAEPDRVKFTYTGNNGKVYQKKKGVIPDGIFVLTNRQRQRQGLPAKVRFLLEMDMATHDTPSFGIEKIAAGAAYIRSGEYLKRFEANAGRWLLMTTGEKRMKNLIQQAKKYANRDKGLFFFTTKAVLEENNLFKDEIWWQADEDHPKALPLT